jgi:hypothetical protein
LIKLKLIVIALLLASNIGAFFFNGSIPEVKTVEVQKPAVIRKAILSKRLLDSLVKASLLEYSIPDSFYFISKKAKKISKIFVPEDIPLPTVENALYNKFINFEAIVSCGYKKKEKGTVFNIRFKDSTSFSFTTQKKKGYFRSTSTITIVIRGFEETLDEERDYLMGYPEPFVVLLRPTKKSQVFSKDFIDLKLSYAVLVGDNATDLEYRISENHPKKRIEATINGLINGFPDAAFYFTESESELAKSVILPFVREKFEGKGKQFINSNIFVNIPNSDSAETVFKFNELYSKNKGNKNLVFIIEPKSLKWLESEIIKLRRKGVKISKEINSIKQK